MSQLLAPDSKAVVVETTTLSTALHEAISQGWKPAWRLIFGDDLVDAMAHHHVQTARWHWAARHRICRGERPFNDYYADFPMWPRGHMKSTLARCIAVMDAIIELYYGRTGGYCLYFSGTDEKTTKHAISIDKLLRSPAVRFHAPLLTQVQKSEERSLGWRATFFYTAAGYVYHFGSLQSGLAGGNVGGIRPTMVIPDDIDDRKNSVAMSEKNFAIFTTEILPMGAHGTLTLFAQNLISRMSIMYRIYKGIARVLTNRRPSKPIPALIGMKTEQRAVTVRGQTIVQDVITAGTPTWKYMGVTECQDELNRIGVEAFMAELQHEVEGRGELAMLHNYNDSIHAISQSEFASVFGSRSMPATWIKEWGNDWARTKTKFHANVALWRTVSPRNSKLPGFSFIFHPMSFKANAQPEDVAERVLSCLEPYAIRREPPAKSTTWAELRRDELLRANALEHTTSQLDRIEFERAALRELFPRYTEAVLREHNVVGGVNSHEREDIRGIYNSVYALRCVGINPGKYGGVEQINRELAVDYNEPHPFRPDVGGFTRWFVVVPDDKEQVPRIVNGAEVYPPTPYPEALSPEDLHDDALFRYQMVNWEQRPAKLTETGEIIDEPLKVSDDFGNLLQMAWVNGGLQNAPETPEEEFQMLIPEELKMPTPDKVDPARPFTMQDQQKLAYAEWMARGQMVEKYGEDVLTAEDDGGSIFSDGW